MVSPVKVEDAIVQQLDDAQGAIPRAQRYADCGSYRGERRRVTFHGETGIVAGLRHDHRFAVLSYPAGDSLAHTDPQVAIAGRLAGRDRVIEILLLFVDDEQGPGFGLEKLLHLQHDGAQNRIQVEGGGQRTRYVVKDLRSLGSGGRLGRIIDHSGSAGSRRC